jgi:hypothetical protein
MLAGRRAFAAARPARQRVGNRVIYRQRPHLDPRRCERGIVQSGTEGVQLSVTPAPSEGGPPASVEGCGRCLRRPEQPHRPLYLALGRRQARKPLQQSTYSRLAACYKNPTRSRKFSGPTATA